MSVTRSPNIHCINLSTFGFLELRNTRNTRKGSIDEPFVLDLWIVPEVHQQAKLLTGRLQVVDHLSSVFIGQPLDRLDFQDDFAETQKIGFVLLLQRPTLVLQSKSRLLLERDLLLGQFSRQTFLIHGFCQ